MSSPTSSLTCDGTLVTRGEAAHCDRPGDARRGAAARPRRTHNSTGVQQALLAAATAEKDGGPLGAMARTLGRLPYRTADQVSRTDAFLRAALELSRQLDRHAARPPGVDVCAAVELMARLQPKLFAIPVGNARRAAGDRDGQYADGEADRTGPADRRPASARRRRRGRRRDAAPRRLGRIQLRSAPAGDALDVAGAAAPVLREDRLDYLRTGMTDT